MTNIAVFASGTGSNFEAIADACASGELDAKVALVVCDFPDAPVVKKSLDRGIDTIAFSPKDYQSKADYESMIALSLSEHGVTLVCLAGYMRIIGPTLLQAYGGRIINIHPSLLPSFKGVDGVKQAFDYGVKVFGVTIHYVDESLDGGKIISQQAFEYYGDDIEEVRRKGHSVEHRLYVSTIRKLISLQ